MTLNVDVISDIHSDIWKYYTGNVVNIDGFKNEGSNILVVAGDTGNNVPETIEFIRNECRSNYDRVIFIDGNHEHYNYSGDVEDAMADFVDFSENEDGVDFLYGKNTVLIGDTLFVGANSWYDFRIGEPEFTVSDSQFAWMNQSNDSRYITTKLNKGSRVAFPKFLCDLHVSYIEKVVADAQDNDDIHNIVVVTHASPLKRMAVPHGHHGTPLMGAYGNVTAKEKILEADKKNKINYWFFGHVHSRDMTVDNNVCYMTNCLGYPGEDKRKFSMLQVDVTEKYRSAFEDM